MITLHSSSAALAKSSVSRAEREQMLLLEALPDERLIRTQTSRRCRDQQHQRQRSWVMALFRCGCSSRLKAAAWNTEVRAASGYVSLLRTPDRVVALAPGEKVSCSHQAVGGPRSRAACGTMLVTAVAGWGSSAPLGALLGAVQLCDCK